MTRLASFALLAVSLGACHREPSLAGFGPDETAAPASPSPDAPDAPPGDDPRALALAPLTLGWAELPRLPNANAVADRRVGLDALEAGELDDALVAFERALRGDPDYAWAHWDRARTLALLAAQARADDDPDAAAEAEVSTRRAFAELARLVQRDRPRFGPRVETEPAFAELREGRLGELLETLRVRTDEAYAAALERGALAWIYQPRAALNPRTDAPQAPYEDLRVGVFDGGRFVPLSPDHPLALATLVDRQAGRVLVVSGEMVTGEMWVVQPRDLDVHLYGVEALGAPIIAETRVDERRNPTKSMRSAIVAAIEGDAVRLGYLDLGYEPGELTTLITATKLEIVARTVDSPAGLDGDPEARAQQLALHVQPDQAQVRIDGHGPRFHIPAASVAVNGRRLHVEGRGDAVELAAAHDLPDPHVRLERSADGRWLLVLSQTASCGESGARSSYALSRVDLERGRATILAEGQGFAGASMAADGTIYFETPQTVARIEVDSTRAIEDLPERVHFALPGYAADCGI